MGVDHIVEARSLSKQLAGSPSGQDVPEQMLRDPPRESIGKEPRRPRPVLHPDHLEARGELKVALVNVPDQRHGVTPKSHRPGELIDDDLGAAATGLEGDDSPRSDQDLHVQLPSYAFAHP